MNNVTGKLPSYGEAYPRFDVVQAKAANERGKDICTFIDEKRRVLGAGFISEVTTTELTLEYRIGGPYLGFLSGPAIFKLEPAPNGVDKLRLIVRCPECHQCRWVLLLVDRWACAGCHKLLYRKQLLTKNTILWERMKTLGDKIGRGRPRGMHQRTYDPLRAELQELRRRLKGQWPAVASVEHSYRIATEWLTVDEGREHLLVYGEYDIINGSPVVVRR